MQKKTPLNVKKKNRLGELRQTQRFRHLFPLKFSIQGLGTRIQKTPLKLLPTFSALPILKVVEEMVLDISITKNPAVKNGWKSVNIRIEPLSLGSNYNRQRNWFCLQHCLTKPGVWKQTCSIFCSFLCLVSLFSFSSLKRLCQWYNHSFVLPW